MEFGKFLLADDAFYIRKHLKSILKTQGYKNFIEVADGSEAVKKYKSYKPDIVFMDIIMPEEDGITALKEIIEYDKNANIIILTALSQKKVLLEAIEAGANNYIIKPFTPDQVINALEEIIYAKDIKSLVKT